MSVKKSKAFQACVSILLFAVMLLSFWTPIAKADYEEPPNDLGVMEITGVVEEGRYVVTPKIPENLFDLDGSVYPGGSWQKTIRVSNTVGNNLYFQIVSVTNKIEDPNLFDALTLKIESDGDTIYEGPYSAGSEEDPISEYFPIGYTLSRDFVVTVSLSSDIRNVLQGNVLDSFWNFNLFFDEDAEEDLAEYYVYYEDEEGNELHKGKIGAAKVGSIVTEQAVEIEGYTPDEQEKSIKIQKLDSKNVIRFIYSPKEAPIVPDEPEDPSEAPTEDLPSTPKTGYELTDNRMTMLMLSSCMALFLIAAVLVVRKSLAKPIKTISDSSTEEAHQDE